MGEAKNGSQPELSEAFHLAGEINEALTQARHLIRVFDPDQSVYNRRQAARISPDNLSYLISRIEDQADALRSRLDEGRKARTENSDTIQALRDKQAKLVQTLNLRRGELNLFQANHQTAQNAYSRLEAEILAELTRLENRRKGLERFFAKVKQVSPSSPRYPDKTILVKRRALLKAVNNKEADKKKELKLRHTDLENRAFDLKNMRGEIERLAAQVETVRTQEQEVKAAQTDLDAALKFKHSQLEQTQKTLTDLRQAVISWNRLKTVIAELSSSIPEATSGNGQNQAQSLAQRQNGIDKLHTRILQNVKRQRDRGETLNRREQTVRTLIKECKEFQAKTRKLNLLVNQNSQTPDAYNLINEQKNRLKDLAGHVKNLGPKADMLEAEMLSASSDLLSRLNDIKLLENKRRRLVLIRQKQIRTAVSMAKTELNRVDGLILKVNQSRDRLSGLSAGLPPLTGLDSSIKRDLTAGSGQLDRILAEQAEIKDTLISQIKRLSAGYKVHNADTSPIQTAAVEKLLAEMKALPRPGRLLSALNARLMEQERAIAAQKSLLSHIELLESENRDLKSLNALQAAENRTLQDRFSRVEALLQFSLLNMVWPDPRPEKDIFKDIEPGAEFLLALVHLLGHKNETLEHRLEALEREESDWAFKEEHLNKSLKLMKTRVEAISKHLSEETTQQTAIINNLQASLAEKDKNLDRLNLIVWLLARMNQDSEKLIQELQNISGREGSKISVETAVDGLNKIALATLVRLKDNQFRQQALKNIKRGLYAVLAAAGLVFLLPEHSPKATLLEFDRPQELLKLVQPRTEDAFSLSEGKIYSVHAARSFDLGFLSSLEKAKGFDHVQAAILSEIKKQAGLLGLEDEAYIRYIQKTFRPDETVRIDKAGASQTALKCLETRFPIITAELRRNLPDLKELAPLFVLDRVAPGRESFFWDRLFSDYRPLLTDPVQGISMVAHNALYHQQKAQGVPPTRYSGRISPIPSLEAMDLDQFQRALSPYIKANIHSFMAKCPDLPAHQPPDRIDDYIRNLVEDIYIAADKFQVPLSLMITIAHQESYFANVLGDDSLSASPFQIYQPTKPVIIRAMTLEGYQVPVRPASLEKHLTLATYMAAFHLNRLIEKHTWNSGDGRQPVCNLDRVALAYNGGPAYPKNVYRKKIRLDNYLSQVFKTAMQEKTDPGKKS